MTSRPTKYDESSKAPDESGLFLSPIGDDPESWSATVWRIGSVRVRLHVLLVLYIASEMFRAVFQIGGEATNSAGIVAISLAGLTIAALVHETGRALITRLAGGEANAIVLWPLGGLATHRLPSRTRGQLIAAVGGLAASVTLACVVWPALFALTPNWYSVLSDPLRPSPVYAEWVLVSGERPALWLSALWWLGYSNLIILIANLIPIYPLDGATVVEIAGARVLGRRRGASIAITLALSLCLALLLAGLMTNNVMMVFLAGFGWVCGTRRARQSAFVNHGENHEWSDDGLEASPSDADVLLDDLESEMAELEEGVVRAPRSLANFETDTFIVGGRAIEVDREDDEAEMDRLLAKISHGGVGSLTPEEKRTLKLITARRRERG